MIGTTKNSNNKKPVYYITVYTSISKNATNNTQIESILKG